MIMGIQFLLLYRHKLLLLIKLKIAKNVNGMPLKPLKSGAPEALTLASFIALCSASLGKPVQGQMVVLGDMSLGGTITQTRNLAESLQVAFDAGAKRILLPMSSVTDIPSVPGELFAKFQTSFYSDPVDAAFKALCVE